MNIKELLKQPKKLAPGHRTCRGCAIPILTRTIMAATDKPVVVCAATGCMEVTTTVYPQTSWKGPFIHSAFENAAATISGVSRAFQALKKKGKMKKEVKFVAFGGDGGTSDIGLQSLSGALERREKIVYIQYDNEGYMNCLSLDSMIMARDGLKRITDIKVGDMIYAFGQKDHMPILKKCTGIFDNGVKEVFELSTLHHSIKATSNHPFLVLKRNGRGKDAQFVWKTLGQLKQGEEVITLKNNPLKESSFVFKPVQLSKKGDYKVNKLNEIKIPKKSSKELMEFLGLYVGDGWLRLQRGEVGFALPQGTEESKRLIKLSKKVFGKDLIQNNKNYIYIHSVNLARFIDSLGFGNGAKRKIAPPWVFTLPKAEKEAFVSGLMQSDGYKIGKSHRYVSASHDLLKTLRLLLQTIGYQVGKIHQQTKKKGTFCVYRQLLEDSTYGYICFSKKRIPDITNYLSQTKQRDFLADNQHFGTEKIISIKLVKKEPTLDLRVEGEHNFIADGIVVHNTGHQRSSATPFGAATTTTPDGAAIHGKMEFRKDITKIVAAHNIPYVAQAAVHNWSDLVMKAKKAFEVDGPAFINVLSPCPENWSYPNNLTIEMSKLAVNSNFWPLYEVENGVFKLNFIPTNPVPIEKFLRSQTRFRHLFNPENKRMLEIIQEQIDNDWKKLLETCHEKQAVFTNFQND